MIRLTTAVLLMSASAAQAASFDTLDVLSQDQFELFAENISAATHYKSISPPESLGLLGFDVGLSVSYTDIDLPDLFEDASGGEFDLPGIPLPRASVHKGLPFNIDVGASASGAPGTDITVLGVEARVAILDGNIALPAIGLRATGSIIQGVDELDMQSTSLDISISKGFLMFTPYAGIGVIRTTVTPNEVETLDEVTMSATKTFAGLNLNLGLINFSFEADKTGDYSSASIKTGFRF